MKKSSIFGIIIMVLATILVIYFNETICDFMFDNFKTTFLYDNFQYGESTGTYGDIKLKIKTDESGAIKELYVYDYDDQNEINVDCLQKMVNNSKDKYNATEIDSITGATLTSETYKKALNNALGYKEEIVFDNLDKVSLQEENIKNMIERKEVIDINSNTYKTGIGAYIQNNLFDAEYNKNGELVTHEYVCGVMLQQNNRIIDIKFDHIASNMSYDAQGCVPIGSARSYTFLPDSKKQGFVGLCSDENYINMVELESKCRELMYFQEINKYFSRKKGYEPFLQALSIAMDNSRSIGAVKGDTLGISCKKILDKKDIIDAKFNENGQVTFVTEYLLLSVNKDLNISSCIIDSASNKIKITSDGKIFGSKENEVHTVVDLSNTNKYSKVEKKVMQQRMQYNSFADLSKGNTVSNMLTIISSNTDNKGQWINTEVVNFDMVDFLTLIELYTDAFLQARII